jgi:hypothetical protein
MRISGFSFARNADKLYYPVVEAIRSILPICDEFVIAIGKGDEDDRTREQVASIGDPRVRIINTEWEERYFKKGIVNAIQTDIAREACSGDWLFYVQADEVVHEKYLPAIRGRCEQLLGDRRVDGLLFRYRHFWGDYDHYQGGHGWYPNEIRIVRNDPSIHSWQSAQSFRRFDHYDNPRQPEGTHKLSVARVDAEIYHYGWVRPPHLMQNKRRALDSVHWGSAKAREHYDRSPQEFDYGPLDRLATFRGTHPAVMRERIGMMDWAEKLQVSGKPDPTREPHKHERLKYRVLSLLERLLNGGREIGGFRNYRLVRPV